MEVLEPEIPATAESNFHYLWLASVLPQPPSIIGFWLLMGIAAVWSVIAAFKFGRQGS
jgi:hypothetical protein